jgi:hypothetical protein
VPEAKVPIHKDRRPDSEPCVDEYETLLSDRLSEALLCNGRRPRTILDHRSEIVPFGECPLELNVPPSGNLGPHNDGTTSVVDHCGNGYAYRLDFVVAAKTAIDFLMETFKNVFFAAGGFGADLLEAQHLAQEICDDNSGMDSTDFDADHMSQVRINVQEHSSPATIGRQPHSLDYPLHLL